jgi:hypothetical protein
MKLSSFIRQIAAGLPFIPAPGEDDVHKAVAEVSKLQGEEAFKFVISFAMTELKRY